jgi:hypothetical protein
MKSLATLTNGTLLLRPDLSILLFSLLFWLGQGVTWVMDVFLYCPGVLYVYGVVYHLGVYVCL